MANGKRIIKQISEAIHEALQTVAVTDEGGRRVSGPVNYFRWLARKDPKTFALLVGRLIPGELRDTGTEAVLIVRDYTGQTAEADDEATATEADDEPTLN